jgi:excisionase family DNA binding protein
MTFSRPSILPPAVTREHPGALPLPEPEAIDQLGQDALHAFLLKLTAVQGRVTARIAALALEKLAGRRADDGDGERLLTIPEVADRLRVPKQHAYELARRELPAVRFGKYVRVRVADLEAWVKRHQE